MTKTNRCLTKVLSNRQILEFVNFISYLCLHIEMPSKIPMAYAGESRHHGGYGPYT